MPQTVSYSISVKVDKGPDLKSESKFDGGSYSASVEELVCRGGTVLLDIGAAPADLELLVIASTLYKNDKEPCPSPEQISDRCLKFQFLPSGADTLNLVTCCAPVKTPTPDPSKDEYAPKSDRWCALTRPLVFAGPSLGALAIQKTPITQVAFKNDLASDVKVSVLAVKRCCSQCAC